MSDASDAERTGATTGAESSPEVTRPGQVSGSDAATGTEDEPDEQSPEQLRDQREQRLAKLDAMRAAGVEPYPVRFDATATAGSIRAEHGELPAGESTDVRVRIAGRLLLLRRQGKLSFATLQDRDGTIQLFVSTNQLGDERHKEFDHLDRGDWVGVEGTVMATRRGELSVAVESWELLAKAVRPLPDKWHGLADVDTRYRQRYVDLVVNDEARRIALGPHRDHRRAPPASHRAQVPRGRGSGAADDPGGSDGAALRHPPQRARPGHVPAHRARAPPQAAHRRRPRPRLRDRARVPQRRRGHDAQPGVHDARGLPGLRRLPRHDGPRRGAGGRERAGGRAADAGHGGRRDDRPGRTVPAGDDGRPHQGARRCRHPPGDGARGGTHGVARARSRVRAGLGSGEAHERGLRRARRGQARPADVRARPPARGVAARARRPGRPDARRAFRARRQPARARQCVQRAQRPGRPAGPLRGGGRAQAGRGSRGRRRRPRLRPGAGVRDAPDGWARTRHRPTGHVAHGNAVDPRGDLVPDAAPRAGHGRSRHVGRRRSRRGDRRTAGAAGDRRRAGGRTRAGPHGVAPADPADHDPGRPGGCALRVCARAVVPAPGGAGPGHDPAVRAPRRWARPRRSSSGSCS